MISSVAAAYESFFSLLHVVLTLPMTAWDKLKEIVRSTISTNGYTAIDGVFEDEGETKDDETEEDTQGEAKDETGT